MNKDQIDGINAYFKKQIAQCKEQTQTLTSESRSDEAVFSRIQMNVYDILNTVFATAMKMHGDDCEKAKEFFLQKTEQLSKAWQISLETAEQHGAFEKAYIERIKLDTIIEAKETLEMLWEEPHD